MTGHSAGRRSAAAGLAAVLALMGSACASATPGAGTHAASGHRPAAGRRATAFRSATSTTTTTSTSTLPGAGRPAITIGDKNYSEQFVLGQLYLQALQAQGFTVTITQNIGPIDVTLQALQTGALTMYPEYLNLFDSTVAGYQRGFRSRLAAYRAAQSFALGHGLSLLAPTPFSDTDAIAVTDAFAQDNGLRSIFDLRRVAGSMTMAGPAQFAQLDPGLPLLASAYGVTPQTFTALPVGGQYAALNAGTVQAAYVKSTDGQLASGDYQLLADQRRIFGWGNVVPVVSAKLLAQEGPAFAATIEQVDRMLSNPVMRQLNALVDVAKQDPTTVATQFLETHGLVAAPAAGT